MRLKALNSHIDTKYGFSDTLEYDDETFHGHQRGIAVCIMEGDRIHRNYMVPMDPLADKDELLRELLADKKIKLLEEDAPFMNDKTGEIIFMKVYYLPYANIDHTVFKPTINFDRVDGSQPEYEYNVQAEVLLVKGGANRYFTADGHAKGVSMMGFVREFLSNPDLMKEVGFTYVSAEEEDEEDAKEGWYIDMYNQANCVGRRYVGKNVDEILDYASSIRLIGLETFDDCNGMEDVTPDESEGR